mmetsp:Transcript_9611/g.17522  ORF Transcript_9611/g.17522 Transcript_9611/m.17522 type:complete len:452 (+) Transcript_9611:108-1463(+)
MPSSSSTSSSVPLIKGYLPVRLRIPVPSERRTTTTTTSGSEGEHQNVSMDETFFYVREHRGKQQQSTEPATEEEETKVSTKSGTTTTTATLFVANAPIIPGISTKILLKSIFGRFADVTRVTVVQNPRAAAATLAIVASLGGEPKTTPASFSSSSSASSLTAWSDKSEFFYPTFLPPIMSSKEGKYAHVVFGSVKEMKKAKKALEDLMTPGSSHNKGGSRNRRNRRSKGKHDDKDIGTEEATDKNGPALELDSIEIQTLSDESLRQWEERRRNVLGIASADDSDDDGDYDVFNTETSKIANSNNSSVRKHASVLAVAHRYQESCKLLSRSKLLEECNLVMQAYEEAEEAKRRAQEAARSQPDEDGFVTVSYSNAVGSKVELEESATATTPSRRKGNKRSRKKKEGSKELTDFYRFQRRENRKRTMEDLRKQFDEDLKKVKRMKDEKQYRPF